LSWQNEIYLRLRDREWHSVGVLFESIEQDIPLHIAMRRYLGGTGKDRQIPPNTEARWLSFKAVLSKLGVEVNSGTMRGLGWNTQVRLSYIKDQQCETCDGPVIKKGWSVGTNRYICLNCEKVPVPVISPCELTVPTDLVEVPLLESCPVDVSSVSFVSPLPQPKRRKRKRRIKAKWVQTPRLVSPPVIKQPPTLVKTPKPLPESEPVQVSKPIPQPKPEIISIQNIWENFIRQPAAPKFDHNPKLRQILYRAMEAGVIDEYSRMKVSVTKELADLQWPNTDLGGRLMGIRAMRWVETTTREHTRRRWGQLLIEAYTWGSLGIMILTINGKLELIANEIERLIAKRQSMPAQPPQPPQPARLRWGAPIKQARNVVSRWFTR